MILVDAARTTTFRWGLAIAMALLVQSAVLSALFYWATARHATAQVERSLEANCRSIRGLPRDAVIKTVQRIVGDDVHRVDLAGLFGSRGEVLAGNIATLPPLLAARTGPLVVGLVRTEPPNPQPNESLALACPIVGGGLAVFARDTDEIAYIRSLAMRALLIVALPSVIIAAVMGLILSHRAQRRFSQVQQAIDKVMSGDLRQRLPARSSVDTYDRLTTAVNAILDRLEGAISDLRFLGDDIAHELRTPLTRLRARLERGCGDAQTAAEFRDVGERAIRDIDHALSLVSAILRIRNIEEAKRGSEFAQIDARRLLQDAAELYRPSADLRAITIRVEDGPKKSIHADRDLMMEAICNLIDNAVKFAPDNGMINCSMTSVDGGAVSICVADNGPGIALQDRDLVFRRFHRGREQPSIDGHGIGLTLVAAVVRLHRFTLRIADAEPGCAVTIICAPDAGGATSPTAIRTDVGF